MRDNRSQSDDRWRARPVLAVGLRWVIFLVPIAVSLGVTGMVRLLLPALHGWPGRAVWWGVLLCIGVGVALAVERVARRALPLVTLLKLSMLFPDQAPSRFAVAKRAGSIRQLEARVNELQDDEARGDASSAATILALATALQNHDRRTRGHAERVRVFSDLLGAEMRLPADDRYRLRWAALLHDIGKLTVKAGILNKPDKLNDGEWEVMRRHPLEGARIADPLLEWLGAWGRAIAEHHERFDGAGYPSRLAGGEISLAGRIVAVADAYDTMTAARSYRKPVAVRAARQELADCAGGQFDPVVVRAFFSISLPLLLWKTGPLSFLAHLPFLARLQAVGQQSLAAAVQGVTFATLAAGVTAITIAGPAMASKPPVSSGLGVVAVNSVDGHPGATADAGGGQTGGGSGGGPMPSPIPMPSPTPSPTPIPSGSPAPSASPSPNPSTSPSSTTSPEPSESVTPGPTPTETVPPLPSPTVSVPPLPTPTVSVPPLPAPTLSIPPLRR